MRGRREVGGSVMFGCEHAVAEAVGWLVGTVQSGADGAWKSGVVGKSDQGGRVRWSCTISRAVGGCYRVER